eukprot:TRINITY_DN33586_c0_g1_i1.p1 TRINITY_DN33586_c0_g1~~TRINITY_DN33586_c0_g1_i1.p1  ORF type:complete len:489 (+),score=90.67 TRINITY_DN33586_c0_g1_i1:72-1538(+)
MPAGRKRGRGGSGHSKRRRRGAGLQCEYAGFQPTERQWAVERLTDPIAPRAFWERFVAPRRPCVLSGAAAAAGPAARAASRWTDDYLQRIAGAERIDVEVRGKAGAEAGFGRGRKVRMDFGEVVRRLAGGDESLYVTTQTLPVDDDGPTQVSGPPLGTLRADFPARPKLMGGLIPYQHNLWYGRARDGSSSGLHHDHHDNLYCLLRGRKRFTLLPPSDAPLLRTASRPVAIHANGLINYHCRTRPDGAHQASVAEWRLRMAEEHLDRLREADAPEEELEAAEAAVDEAMDAVADAGAADPAELQDDFEDTAPGGPRVTTDVEGTTPGSFCAVPAEAVRAPAGEAARRGYPELSSVHPSTVEINAGELLYLPCGWFHEVTSYSAGGPHMALNYWFHPPAADAPFERPYADDFWLERWHSIDPEGAAGVDLGAPAAAGAGEAAAAAPLRRTKRRCGRAVVPMSAKRRRRRRTLGLLLLGQAAQGLVAAGR